MDLHEALRFWWQDLCCVDISLYDPASDQLTTFFSSQPAGGQERHCRARLADAPSLVRLADLGTTRVINDLRSETGLHGVHRERLLQAGYRSSYTVPMYTPDGSLNGFLFFDAEQADYFDDGLVRHLDVYAELLSALIQSELASPQVLSAAIFTAKRFGNWRDQETGTHLARVAHYARMIATNLAPRLGLSNEYIEFIYQFAPLHDIGKVAVPDEILLNPGTLDHEQEKIMRAHVGLGLNIVDELVGNFGLSHLKHVDMLRYIVLYHHERWDGCGYPSGLRGEAIPLPARIVGLADCFDALLSDRSYKEPWTYSRTKAHILAERGRHFDARCVDAFFVDESHIHAIRDRFLDGNPGDWALQ